MDKTRKQLLKTVDNVFDEIADLLEVDRKKLKSALELPENKKIIFDENTGKICFNNKECQIPFKTNQYYLCKKLFSIPKNRIDEIDIMDSDLWKENTNRSVYDAVRLVNAKIKDNLEIEDLLKWQKNTVWVNDSYHEYFC